MRPVLEILQLSSEPKNEILMEVINGNDDIDEENNDENIENITTEIIERDNKVELEDYFKGGFKQNPNHIPWEDMDNRNRRVFIIFLILKISLVLGSLYFFICSLSFMADSFRLLAGKEAAQLFRESDIINNPMAGLIIGILVTVLVQSSSTSTSIIISMVAADLLTKRSAIFIVMGANIGTSITSTIVAFGQINESIQFMRAFAAATIHDTFNFLTVFIFLPLEWMTGYLNHLSTAIVGTYDNLKQDSGAKKEYLKKITKDFTSLICKLDKKKLNLIAEAEGYPNIKNYPEYNGTIDSCPTKSYIDTRNSWNVMNNTLNLCPDGYENWPVMNGTCCTDGRIYLNNLEEGTIAKDGWCAEWDMNDKEKGILFLFISLLILCGCLIIIVKTLNSILKGQVAKILHKIINTKIPTKVGKILTGYLLMLCGMGITIGVQSSSITTSILTPLVGVGVIELDTLYPMVLGANIGTTMTAVLAALASSAEKIPITLEVAYAHLFFNLSGIFLYYVIWPLRAVPLGVAKYLGKQTIHYRWYAIIYLCVMFFIMPCILLGLSVISIPLMLIIVSMFIIICVTIGVINIFQNKNPSPLPEKLQTWYFLPEFMYSLEPLDRFIKRCFNKRKFKF